MYIHILQVNIYVCSYEHEFMYICIYLHKISYFPGSSAHISGNNSDCNNSDSGGLGSLFSGPGGFNAGSMFLNNDLCVNRQGHMSEVKVGEFFRFYSSFSIFYFQLYFVSPVG
jgi:hypothetical protein